MPVGYCALRGLNLAPANSIQRTAGYVARSSGSEGELNRGPSPIIV